MTNLNLQSNKVSGYLSFRHFLCITDGNFLKIIMNYQRACRRYLSQITAKIAAAKNHVTSNARDICTTADQLKNISTFHITVICLSADTPRLLAGLVSTRKRKTLLVIDYECKQLQNGSRSSHTHNNLLSEFRE